MPFVSLALSFSEEKKESHQTLYTSHAFSTNYTITPSCSWEKVGREDLKRLEGGGKGEINEEIYDDFFPSGIFTLQSFLTWG